MSHSAHRARVVELERVIDDAERTEDVNYVAWLLLRLYLRLAAEHARTAGIDRNLLLELAGRTFDSAT